MLAILSQKLGQLFSSGDGGFGFFPGGFFGDLMCKGLLQEVFRLILAHIYIEIRISVLHLYFNR